MEEVKIRTLTYLLTLLVLSIPWYFPSGSTGPIVAGFPLWCLVSLCCYVAVAAITVWRIEDLWRAEEREEETEEE